jgi:ATP-dependent Lhr-like helicase
MSDGRRSEGIGEIKEIGAGSAQSPQSPNLPAANPILTWFTRNGWTPFDFQRESWAAYTRGQSGLIHAPTGMGKSYAAWLGPLSEWTAAHPDPQAWAAMTPEPLRVLWITPLRALAADTANTLRLPVEELGLPWTVELRTGDTSSHVKQRQRNRLPTALVTTPESLSLLLSYAETRQQLRTLRCVVVDEWHELLGSKRGVQTELALAHLRAWTPDLRIWGLSATLGNLEQALAVLLGKENPQIEQPVIGEHPQSSSPLLISGAIDKKIVIDTLIPPDIERFPWAGHLGTKLLPAVVDGVGRARTTLIFTNTRAQCELWFQGIVDYVVDHVPELIGAIGLHHGSLDPELRREVEARLRDGRLRCVVCTSSLDLGVDFAPVDQVIQVGSPKGIVRLLQRAGRSGHRPGAASRVLCVPTHAFELVEFAAARDALSRREIEPRSPLEKPLDVLVQHLVTMAVGGGFVEADLVDEVRLTYAYRNLSEDEWRWALDFVTFGSESLRAYEEFAKVSSADGRYRVSSPVVAKRHRMSIGTITSDGMLQVKYQQGSTLGSIEEAFIGRLKPGDVFIFAGRALELALVKEMTAYVRRAKRSSGIVPAWYGGRLPLSSQLADAVRLRLAAADLGIFDTPEMAAVQPLLELQRRWSRLPVPGELLIERTKTRDGHHLFLYPLAGRLVHEGLATLLAYRLSRRAPRTISAYATDYGCELLSPTPIELDEAGWRSVLTTDQLLEDVLACLNQTELARRQFRDIARIAGLVFSGYPGSHKTTRQLQSSSGVIFDVFNTYDPENGLLIQAKREVLDQQLDITRLRQTLAKIEASELVQVTCARLTPLAFPIYAERLRQTQVSSESWEDRIRRMVGGCTSVGARPGQISQDRASPAPTGKRFLLGPAQRAAGPGSGRSARAR